MDNEEISIGDVLLKDLMITDEAPFRDKDELYEYISQKFFQNGIVSGAEAFKESLYRREELGSTYMGNEIAIPHGKCKEVIKPGIGFIRCREDFLYQSGGEEGPVRFIFVLAVSESQEDYSHLRILARLAGYLAKEEFLELICRVETHQELLEGILKIDREEC